MSGISDIDLSCQKDAGLMGRCGYPVIRLSIIRLYASVEEPTCIPTRSPPYQWHNICSQALPTICPPFLHSASLPFLPFHCGTLLGFAPLQRAICFCQFVPPHSATSFCRSQVIREEFPEPLCSLLWILAEISLLMAELSVVSSS